MKNNTESINNHAINNNCESTGHAPGTVATCGDHNHAINNHAVDTDHAINNHTVDTDHAINNHAVATGGDPTGVMDNTVDMPRRKYPRAYFHDYNCGSFFVTVCTKNKAHYFGEIYGNVMHLSVLGRILHENLLAVSRHYPDVAIPSFVVMPNHFHAIIDISGKKGINRIGTNIGRLNQLARLTVATGGDTTSVTHHNCRLGNVVSGIKAHVTRFARHHGIEFGWQTRYHEHIIRGVNDEYYIADYIENNVSCWESDCFKTVSNK